MVSLGSSLIAEFPTVLGHHAEVSRLEAKVAGFGPFQLENGPLLSSPTVFTGLTS